MALNWGSVERLVVWFVDFLYHDVYSNKKKPPNGSYKCLLLRKREKAVVSKAKKQDLTLCLF